MFVLMKSGMSSNLCHLGPQTGSLGQIKEMPCGCFRGQLYCPIDIKIDQNVFLDEICNEFEFRSPGVMNWVIQIIEIPCWCSRGHICRSVDLKIGQNVCLNEIWEEFQFGSPGVTN